MNVSSLSEIKSQISLTMKQVDELVKQKKYQPALEKVRTILESDVKNTYARAYEERILTLIMDRNKEELHIETEKVVTERVETEVRRRLREFQQQQEIEAIKRKQFEKKEDELETNARKATTEERQGIVQKGLTTIEAETTDRIKQIEERIVSQMEKSFHDEQRRLEEESKRRIAELTISLQRVATINNEEPLPRDGEMIRYKNEYEEKLHKAKEHYEKRLFKTLETERLKIENEAFSKMRAEQNITLEKLSIHNEEERQQLILREQQKGKERSLDAYRSLIISMNTLSLDETIQGALLQSLRISFNIVPDEHAYVMRAVQLNAYIDAVKGAWQKGKPGEDEIMMINNLKSLYQISDGEHEQIVINVKKELRLPDESAVILAIDDDEIILQFVAHILKQTYKTVLTACSVDEGLKLIKQVKPSIILCDVHLKSPGMGGFAFYQNITKGEYGDEIKEIPFVLMSSISDEFFVQSAKQLGVNAYVPKPFTREILQSTVYSSLNKLSPSN